MQLRDYLAIAAKNLYRRPARALLTLIALAISVTIVTTLLAISLGTRESLNKTLLRGDALRTIVVSSNRSSQGSSLFGTTSQIKANAPLLDAIVSKVRALAHVQSVSPQAAVWEFKSFRVNGIQTEFSAQAQGIAADSSRHIQLLAGRGFTDGSAEHEVILGAAYAEQLGFGGRPQALIGQTLTITTQDGYQGEGAQLPGEGASETSLQRFAHSSTPLQATIVGVSTQGQNENTILIPMSWAHQVRTLRLATPPKDQIASDGYSSILVTSTSPQDTQQVIDMIQAMGVNASPLLAQFAQLLQFSVIVWLTLGAVSLVALVAASLGVINTMLMMVSEQRFMIGVWRACGASRAQIRRLFIAQAMILGVCGGAIGVGLGYGATFAFNQQIQTLLATQNLPVDVVAVMPWWLVLGVILSTIVFAILSGLYPAIRAARQDPVAALNGN